MANYPITDYANLVKAKYPLGSTIAPTIESLTAAKNWSTGEEFIYSGVKYVFTADVNSGDAIVVSGAGANATESDPVSEQLGSLKQALTDVVSGDTTKVVNFAPIINITDALGVNAVDAKAKIEPVQDLHGYSKPWVGGAGKNKLDYASESISISKANESTFIGNFTCDTTMSVIVSRKQSATLSSANRNTIYLKNNSTNVSYYATNAATDMALSSGYHEGEIQNLPAGNYAVILWSSSISDDYTLTEPMIRSSDDTSSTWAPYTNICPITGHDEVKVTREGKNKATFTVDYIKTQNGGASSWNDYVKTVGNMTFTILLDNGNVVGVNFNGSHTQAVTFKMGTFSKVSSIKVNGCPSGGGANKYGLQIYDETAQSWGVTDIGSGITANNLDPSHVYSLNVFVRANITVDNLVFKAMASVEGGEFEPYLGEVYTIDLGGTRYGGVLDVDAGTLTVDRAFIEYNGTENWTNNTGTPGAPRAYLSGLPTGAVKTFIEANLDKTLCNELEYNTNTIYGGCFSFGSAGVYINYLSEDEDITALKARLASSPVQIVYPLQTTQTINLTPQQILMLRNYNTLFADTGDMSLEYLVGNNLGGVGEAVGELAEKVNLVDDISNVSLTDTSATITSSSYLCKVGKQVIAYIQLSNVTASQNDYIATLPEGYRPISNINALCKKSGDDAIRICPILYDGKIQTPIALSSSTFTIIATSWITT